MSDDKEGSRSAMLPTEDMISRKFKDWTKDLKHINRHAGETKGIRVENLIGFAKVPLGLAGPLRINGHYQKETVMAPLATVEATLVAGVSRGCKAFQACGGVKAFAMGEAMGRAPVFFFNTVDEAVSFYKRLPSLEDQLRHDAEATSRFARLVRITPHIIGAAVHVHFEYTCGDAAGQNMTELATYKACSKLLASPLARELKIIKITPEGNMSADKKVAIGRGARNPRGVAVIAWGVLSDKTCHDVLHCSTADLHQTLRAAQGGDVRNSLDGSSVQVSNTITAMFIATGQDAASVVESCWAQLSLDYDAENTKDLTFSLFLPSLLVGSMGGGTVYPTQKEGLELIKCAGPGKKWALAETIAAFALVSDVSVAASVACNTKAAGHQRLAREAKL